MILFYLLISTMPLTQHPLWGHFVGELTVTKYLGLACVLIAAAYLGFRRGRLRLFATAQAFLFWSLMAWITFSYFYQHAPIPWQLSPMFTYVSVMVLFFITLILVDSPQRLLYCALSAIASVAIASLYVLREWQKYHGAFSEFRPGWVVGDSNYFSVSVLICVPLALLYGLSAHRPRWQRWFCLACLTVTLPAMILGASRGGFLGLIAVVAFVLMRSRYGKKALFLVAALVLPLALVASVSPLERLLHPNASDQAAAQDRLDLWAAGLNMIKAHPLNGIGLGNFKFQVENYEHTADKVDFIAHNAYLEYASELGIPAALLFVGMIAAAFFRLGRERKRLRSLPDDTLFLACGGLQAGLIGYCLSVCFVSGEFQKLFWLAMFLSMAIPPLADEALARVTSPSMAPSLPDEGLEPSGMLPELFPVMQCSEAGPVVLAGELDRDTEAAPDHNDQIQMDAHTPSLALEWLKGEAGAPPIAQRSGDPNSFEAHPLAALLQPEELEAEEEQAEQWSDDCLTTSWGGDREKLA